MIAPLTVRITLTDMVAYAGATWDWHRLHYDVSDTPGLRAPVVDGQMLGALMARQVLDHFGPGAFLRSLDIRYKAMVFAGDTVTIEAESNTDEGTATVTQRVTVGDTLVAEGSAGVLLGA